MGAMVRVLLLCAAAALLSSCGMNRAVGVLPNTVDDLAAKTRGFRGEAAAEPAGEAAAVSP